MDAEIARLNAQIQRDARDAEYFLLNYEAELESYRRAKEEAKMLPCAHDETSGTRRGTMPGHPTEANALKNIEFDRHYPASSWIKAVDIVQRGISDKKLLFLQVRRDASRKNRGKGKHSWVVYVQHHYIEALQRQCFSERVYISERTIHSWWSDIIRRVVEIHCRIK